MSKKSSTINSCCDMANNFSCYNTNVKRVAVFCGSSSGHNKKHQQFARELGEVIAKNKFELVYGGASVGLMNVVADSVKEFGGKVIGVIPKVITRLEVAKQDIDELIEVESMHKRKSLMYQMSDLFLVMPGGLGTLDELFEIVTWKQLSIHDKRIVLCNSDGFFDKLIDYLINVSKEGFVSQEHLSFLEVCNSTKDLDFFLRSVFEKTHNVFKRDHCCSDQAII